MKDKIISSLIKITKLKEEEITKLIEIPPDPNLGDYAFPCFILSKVLKRNPNEIAIELSKKIPLSKEIERIEANGPYINFFINSAILAEETLKKIKKEGEKYGHTKNNKEKIMIEFSQPNTHKAFHIGHVRNTSLGESLARIMESQGNKIIRANYSGDTGMHIAKWLWYYLNYSKEKPREEESWFAEVYANAIKKLGDNERLQEQVNELNKKLEERTDKDLVALWKKTRDLSIKSWKRIYEELGTRFDVHYYESEFEERGKVIAKKLIGEGIAQISEGATIIDLEKYNLGIWVLLRKDGTVLYSAKDLALAEKKFKDFKIDESIILSANEQDLHFKQLIKTLELMKFKYAKNYKHLSYNIVRLPTGKMSSRTGDNVLYSSFKEELANELKKELKKRVKLSDKELEHRSSVLALASLKYALIKQDMDKIIVFDKEESLRFEGNTGPYLLYTYARAKSILKKANNSKSPLNKISLSEKEKALIKKLSSFPDILAHAYRNLSPNLIANYAYELSQEFNEFYHAEKVIGSENESFLLSLVKAFSQVLKNALNLLGIQTLEEM